MTVVQPRDEADLENKAMAVSKERRAQNMRQVIWKQKGNDLVINKIRKYKSGRK